LQGLEDIPCARDNEPVLVEKRRLARFVYGYRLQLVVIGDNVPESRRSIDDTALIDGIYNLLTSGRAQEMLALSHNGDLKGRQGFVVNPGGDALRLGADLIRGVLEGLEAGDEDVGQQEEAFVAAVSLAEATENACRDELAQGGARKIDIVSVVEMRLLIEELSTVDQQTVDYDRSVRVVRMRLSLSH
jgi:hypothetical protein